MRKSLLLGVLLCCLFTGCEADSRVKRASALSVVKVETAKAEFDAAKTPEEQIKVAKNYFMTAPVLLQAVDDYVHGRQPKSDPATPETMVK
jgi:hypothetical protein